MAGDREGGTGRVPEKEGGPREGPQRERGKRGAVHVLVALFHYAILLKNDSVRL